MKEITKGLLLKLHLYDLTRKLVRFWLARNRYYMAFPPYTATAHKTITSSADPVRYATVALAINLIKQHHINGCLAEVGVYRGEMSNFIHNLAPERMLYLFDTFEGFPSQYVESDNRFKDTSIDVLTKAIGDLSNIVIRRGIFPDTARGLEDVTFSFVMLDLDLYEPTLAGLEFFYPRMNSGGYIIVHDYNSPESDWAVSKAVTEFISAKPEQVVETPDTWGSIVIRKI